MAQLAPSTFVAPGTLGLNRENEYNLLDERWATRALNTVFDRSGRLGNRSGWTIRNSAGGAGLTLQRIHEVKLQDGTTELIASGGAKVFRVPASADLSDSANDITSSSAPASGKWKFLNFNNKCIGVQAGETMTVYTGTGDFSDISPSSGTLPDGNAAAAAFGRLWVSDADEQDLRYSGLLDEADWGSADSGGLDMSSIWTQGTDVIMAVAAIGANLIVFGRKHIVIWASAGGTELGLDPTDMYVVDIVEGTGCVARDSVQVTGEGDVLFLSPSGVQSLRRVIAQKNNPLAALTKPIRSLVVGYIQATSDLTDVTSYWSPRQGHYVLNFPGSSVSVVLDTTRYVQDENGDTFTPATQWQHNPVLRDGVAAESGEVYQLFDEDVGQYTGNADNNTGFSLQFTSAWLDPSRGAAPDNLKILKEMNTLVFIFGAITANWSWTFDFGETDTVTKTISYSGGTASEFGVAEWGEAEFGGGVNTVRARIAGAREGQYMQYGVSMTINNAQFLLQQVGLLMKLGRVA